MTINEKYLKGGIAPTLILEVNDVIWNIWIDSVDENLNVRGEYFMNHWFRDKDIEDNGKDVDESVSKLEIIYSENKLRFKHRKMEWSFSSADTDIIIANKIKAFVLDALVERELLK